MDRPYEVFISFKTTDDKRNKTRDAELAGEVYAFFKNKNIRTFFSDRSLEESCIDKYRREIDRALEECTTMIVVGTKTEHLKSEWVYYEWDTFSLMILNGKKPGGRVFLYLEGIDENQLPTGLSRHQAILHESNSIIRLYKFVTGKEERTGKGKKEAEAEKVLGLLQRLVQIITFSKRRIVFGLAIMVFMVSLSIALYYIHKPSPEIELTISEPKNGSGVGYRPLIKGTIPAAGTVVWVIVHPDDTNGYWVQPEPRIINQLRWETVAYIGWAPNSSPNRRFEIMAVGNPRTILREGDQLPNWPDASWRSPVISVRKSVGTD